MIRTLAVFVALVLAEPAWATIRYVDPTAGACTGNYSIASRNCTGTDGDSFATFALALSPTVAGDTIYWRSGTYTTRIALGLKTGSVGSYITIAAYPGETVTIQTTVEGHFVTQSCNTGYFIIDGFTFDGSLLPVPTSGNGTSGVGFFTCTAAQGQSHHFTFSNNIMKEIPRHVFLLSGNGFRIQHNKIYNNRSDCAAGRRFYGIYDSNGDDHLIEHNEIYNTAGGYMQVYPGPLTNIIVRSNYLHDNAYCSTADGSGIIGSNAHGTQFYNNIVANNGSASTSGADAGLQLFGGVDNVLIRNNTFYNNKGGGIQISTASNQSSGLIFENNLLIEPLGSTIFIASGGVADTGRVTNTNKTTGSITDYVVSTSDYSLKSGSACIDFGTARAGFLFSGTAPDCGAFESFAPTSAAIAVASIDVTFDAVQQPIASVLGSTGWTVSCTPACGYTPTVSAVNLLSGAGSILRLTISNISGGSCAAGKTWTVTFDASTGEIQDSALMGPLDASISRNQRGFSFTSLAVTNNCTGAAPSAYPGTPYIYYPMDAGTGTVLVNSGSGGAGLNGTLKTGAAVGGPSWGTGKTGFGVVTTAGSFQYIDIPYGSGVDPTTQSLTIAFGVNVPTGQESATRGEFGAAVGTSQRLAIIAQAGTWRLSIQGSTSSSGASNLPISPGWNHLCLTMNSATDTATLYLNGVAGTGSALKSYTSYTIASGNLKLGLYDINTAPGGTYDDPLVYQSVESCSDIYAAFEPPPIVTGTFSQTATRFQAVYTDGASSPINFGSAINQSKNVIAGGAVAVLIQVDCATGDCDEASYRLEYAKNGSGAYQQVPDTEGVDHIWMWGAAGGTYLNNGNPSTRLTGSCSVTTGSTATASSQVPVFNLPASGCVVMRYIVRVGNNAGDYYDLRMVNQNGIAFTAGYQLARLTVISPTASAGP